MFLRFLAAFPVVLALASVAWGQAGLEKDLRARLALGEFGQPVCAPVTNVLPVDQGFDDIRFDAIPGAHRVVIVPSPSGWRMAMGLPELLVFTTAGFYTMNETTFTGPDGEKRPAREFRLTPKGFMAMARQGQHCFEFNSYQKLDLISSERIQVPERLAGIGEAYSARIRIHYSEFYPWAQTPEFRYVFTKISNAGLGADGPVHKVQTFFLHKGRWYSERETMMALTVDAAALRPENRAQALAMQEKMAAETPDRRMARLASVTASTLREQLALERYRGQLEPCIELPAHQADLTSGLWKKDTAPVFVLYEQSERRDMARYEHATDFLRRLEKAGLAKSEPFEGAPFPKGRVGKGLRFIIQDSAAAALEQRRPTCLPLGTAKIEELQLGHVGMEGRAFRGWGRITEPRPWTVVLATQFPSVRATLDQGFGFSGTVPARDDADILLQLHVPAFGRKPAPRPVRLDPVVPRTGAPVVDQPEGPVRMLEVSCKVSADGTEVSTGDISCTLSRSSRAFRSGKAYAEIVFKGKGKGARPETWTNAAFTTQRSLYSLSTGAAPYSFAGSFNKHLIKDGDVISLAFDLDANVLYWRLNGQWMTGRPGSGLGEPLFNPNDEYFIAVSVQDKAETWRVNFGATPFRFPAPDGFPSYGSQR